MRFRDGREVDVEDGEIVESSSRHSSHHSSSKRSSRSSNNSSSRSYSKHNSKTRKIDDRPLHDHYSSRSYHGSSSSSSSRHKPSKTSSSSSSSHRSDSKSKSSSSHSNHHSESKSSSNPSRSSEKSNISISDDFEKELQEELANMNEKQKVDEILEQRRAMRMGLAAQHFVSQKEITSQTESSPQLEASPKVQASPKIEASPKVEASPKIVETSPMVFEEPIAPPLPTPPEAMESMDDKSTIQIQSKEQIKSQTPQKQEQTSQTKVKGEEEIDLFATNPGEDVELSNPQNSVNSAISGSKDNDIDLFTDSPVENAPSVSSTLNERVMDVNDWDDVEGRLRYHPGEMIDNRYRIIGWHGKGTFGSVMKVHDTVDNIEVAIKIARSHQQMKDAFKVEKDILQELSQIPKNTYCVKLLDCFSYKRHPCLVLEAMKENVRDLLGHYGNKGISLEACRAYAYQLLLSLYYLHSIGVIHADIKPDNMLVSSTRTCVKLCDFGTAKRRHDPPVPPTYGTLFYRAPEIILGYSFETQIDIWSLGVCFVEFFTGKILFSGYTNNHMLYEFMRLKGKIPKKLLKNATYVGEHFELEQYTFLKSEPDKFSGRDVVRKQTVHHLPDTDLLKDILIKNQGNATMEELQSFKDLVDKMLVYDPSKRITPAQALEHKFFAPLKTKTA